MIGYPFDSMITYDEHGNPSYDRAVSSKPLKTLISKLFTTGVMPNPSNNLQVLEGVEGMTVIVKAGFCVIEGGLKLEENDRTLELQAADTTYDRIDTVVMRWNNNDAVRTCDLYVIQGVPSASPVRPALTREGSIYEIGLADVFVPRNSTVTAQYRITDTRMESARCGIVSSVSEFDTTTLYAQVQSDLAEFKADEQADFMAWFESIQDILDENVAAHLQGEIDGINTALGGHTVGANVPSNAVFTNTTYSAGNGLDLSGTEFALKKHSASYINGGTFDGKVQANASAQAVLADYQVRDITISPNGLTPGTSTLAAGKIWIKYKTS